LTGIMLEPFFLVLGRMAIFSQKLDEILFMRMGFPPQYTMKERIKNKNE